MTKTEESKQKAAEAFNRVLPEVRDLTAAALVEGMRAALSWFVGRPTKRKEEDQDV